MKVIFISATPLLGLLACLPASQSQVCTAELEETCSPCLLQEQQNDSEYNCSLPGLEGFVPGIHEGTKANYLSFVTETSSPNLPIRAQEFERCTGGKIVFSEASNVWEDPVLDLGTKTSRGSEVYDGYFMSYSHFPEVSALGLAEHLNERIREDNDRLKWEDVTPKVKAMGEYRKDGLTNIDFLMYDGDFFVPIIRLDLLEKYQLPLPNTWDEVVEYARIFNNTDLNDDGEPDYGFCHFPRLGAGYWDWWASEAMYSTWATYDQAEGISQGFFFDKDTMEPQMTKGFQRSAEVWKDLWTNGNDGCISPNFSTGRCAIGFGPPGCWKGIFLNGISRQDENGTTIWQPTMKSGEYAEPYRFKPFGSLNVLNPVTGELEPCTPKSCPNAEPIPSRGHHSDDDRAKVLEPSPLEGQLVNRAPFYWSGGLGTLIRKSSPKEKKDLMWDFFVYTNSPETSVFDVANYASWLDSWRFSQLQPGENFIQAGWSENAYNEHSAIMLWALSRDVNGAFNLRLPGLAKYTRDVVGGAMQKFIAGELTIQALIEEVRSGWNEVTEQEGKLSQLEIYRSSLGLDLHSEVDLCRLHRDLMDEKDPSLCRKYDPETTNTTLVAILVVSCGLSIAAIVFAYYDRKRKASELHWKIDPGELIIDGPPQVLGRGSFGLVVKAEYRGAQVALKRVLRRPNNQRSGGDADIERQSDFSIGADDKSESDESETPTKPTGLESVESILSVFDDRSGFLERSNDPTGGTLIGIPKGKRSMVPSRRHQRKKTFFGRDEFSQLKAEFATEMKLLSKLRHPCITTIFGAAMGDEPMLVMELMDHGSLLDVLQNETFVLDGDLVLPILRDIAQGVLFLHNASPPIVHGDLKAENILVDGRFHAKVADFGMGGKAFRKEKVGEFGSPYFQAPEILRGSGVNTPASDSYAFGMILYEIYSRKEPYCDCEEDPQEILRLIADESVNKRPPVPTACPPRAASLMAECLSANPCHRPTFGELDLQLKRLDVEMMEPIGNAASKQTRTENLLYEVFPRHIADALRDGNKVEPETRELVTIFFSDVVGFTDISSSISPMKVSNMLDRLYTKFDALCKEHDVHKVETIGDAFMAATGLVKDQPDQVKCIARFAVAAVNAAQETLIDEDDPDRGFMNIRAGFSSGPVVANVVGALAPRYCLFGDVVNVSSRMESTSKKNRIQCTEISAGLLSQQDPTMPLRARGYTKIKGKGELFTYWVNSEFGEQSMASHRANGESPRLSGGSAHLQPARIPRKARRSITAASKGALSNLRRSVTMQ